MFSSLRWTAVGVCVGVATMAALYFRGVKDGTARTTLQWEVKVAQQYAQAAAREATVKAQNAQLQTYVQTLTEAEAHESARVDRLTRSILGSVQARDTRPPAPDADTGRGPTAGDAPRFGTGAELYREDSQFLIGEAARADQIRTALRTCTAQYNAVRHALAPVDTVP
jgi:hypothetical protein